MDKVSKKLMKKAFKEKEQREFEESLPMKGVDFLPLFDFLEEELDEVDCDGGLSLLDKYCKKQNLDFDTLKNWFNQYGGFCDCEILANIEEKFYYLNKPKSPIIQNNNQKKKTEVQTKLNSLTIDFGFSINKVPSPWILFSRLKGNVLHYRFQLGKKSAFILQLGQDFDIEELTKDNFLYNYWKTKTDLDFVSEPDLIINKQSFGNFTISTVSSKDWTPAFNSSIKKN